LEKIKGMDPKDKYNVLEFLVKELINLREAGAHKSKKTRDSDSSEDEKPKKQKSHKEDKYASPDINTSKSRVKRIDVEKLDNTQKKEDAMVEDISVDDNDQIV
jgi:hypothetical protein